MAAVLATVASPTDNKTATPGSGGGQDSSRVAHQHHHHVVGGSSSLDTITCHHTMKHHWEKDDDEGEGEGRLPNHKRRLSISSSNALENFECFQDVVKSKRVVVLLDYDGTLTPIVNDPAKAHLPTGTRDILVELAERCVVGIVSGRSLPKVKGFVQVPSLFYAGSHGFDIWGPTTESMRYQVAADQLPHLATLRDSLTEKLSGITGAAVEDNLFSVSVHYRNCAPDDVPAVYEAVQAARQGFPGIRFGTGKCVFELRPDITWDKGKAMVWLLQALGLWEEEDVFAIYIGDDTTDEDAFQIFNREARADGVGIVVTAENKLTGAKYSLRNPEEVAVFLSRLVETRGHVEAGQAGNRSVKDVKLDLARPALEGAFERQCEWEEKKVGGEGGKEEGNV
ncbi:trehalose-6-phosphate phosphatase [Nannochloropsis oceanica]